MVIDLTAIRDGTGLARLLDMIEGRSEQASTTWRAARPQDWRDGVQVVVTDGSTEATEATDGRPEHLRGTAPGSRDPTHHVARSLPGTSGSRPRPHPHP